MKHYVLAVVMALMLSSCGVGYYHHTSTIDVAGRVNISLQPSWGPSGYDYAMFYYFPDLDIYYDVERALFHYKNYGRWVAVRHLPRGPKFHVDLHKCYKVVINQHTPWHYNRQHRTLYKRYKGVHTQPVLRDIRGGRPPHRVEVSPRQGAHRGIIRNSRNTNVRPSTNARPSDNSRPNTNVKPKTPKEQQQRGDAVKNNPPKNNAPSRGNNSGRSAAGNSNRKGNSAGTRSQGSRGR